MRGQGEKLQACWAENEASRCAEAGLCGEKFGFGPVSYGEPGDFRREGKRGDRADLCFRKKTLGSGTEALGRRKPVAPGASWEEGCVTTSAIRF